MTQENTGTKKRAGSLKRTLIVTIIGVLILIALVIATVIIGKSNINGFVSDNQRYIISIEIIFMLVFFIEMLSRIITMRPSRTDLIDHSSIWRLIIRIVGYTLGTLSVISILASDTTLGISIGAIAGVVIAFAMQNIASSVLAAILIISTRMIKVGEEITINGITGTIADIGLTHTVLSVDEDVVMVPNSLIVANLVRRKKRFGGNSSAQDW